jgi:hypothetical protein
MRRIVASFGIALVDLISSTKGPSKITSSHLGMAIQQMALISSKKMMSQPLKLSKTMIPLSETKG